MHSIHVYLADPTVTNRPPLPTTIVIDLPIPSSDRLDLREHTRLWETDASAIAAAFWRALPGATLDALIAELFRHRMSLFRVSFGGVDEPSPLGRLDEIARLVAEHDKDMDYIVPEILPLRTATVLAQVFELAKGPARP